MAATSKLVIDFAGTNGDVSFSYNYFNPSATITQVQALAAALTTNGSIFENPPVTVKSAKLVTTTEQDYEMNA